MSDKVQFRLVMAGVVLAIFGAWFFLHPASPWHARYHYTILFSEVGTLKPGNNVQVNGIRSGKVVATRLVNDGVEVDVAVLADRAPVDGARIRVTNVGIVGEREVEFRLPKDGKPHAVIPDGSRLRGGFDPGSTRLVYQATSLLRSVDTLGHRTIQLLDSSLLDPQLPGRVRVATDKAKQMVGHVGGLMTAASDSLVRTREDLERLRASLEDLGLVLGKDLDSLGQTLSTADSGLSRVRGNLDSVQDDLEWLTGKLASTRGTAGALLNDTMFHARIRHTQATVGRLVEGIKKNGLDLNVDF